MFSSSRETPTVVNVDDNSLARSALTNALRNAGFNVLEAASADELTKLAQQRPEVILLDVYLPDGNGFDLCRSLRENPASASSLILLISGQTIPSNDRIHGLETGADGFLVKPVEPAEVVAHVKALLRFRQNEEHYHLLTESIPHFVWMTRADGKAEYANARWHEYTGLPADATYGSGWLRLVHPLDRDKASRTWETAVNTGHPYQVEYRLRRADGVYRWHLAQGLPIRDERGSIVKWIGTCTDIHAQKIAEAELRLRDRALLAVSEGILITDPRQPDNPIVFASPGFERLTGYAASEVVGLNCRFLQGKDTNPDTVAEIRSAIRAARPCSVELLNYRKDGSPFWIALSISPVRDNEGEVTHFVGVQTDVTDRKRIEEQLRQAQKMEAVGQLAGGVAHDFNNLLTVINGYGEMLLNQLSNNDSLREAVSEMTKAGERAAALTRQLLAFSRKQVLAPSVLDLNSVVIDLEKMLRRIIGEDIRLTTKLQSPLDPVKVDRGQMEQVILNLVVNARDAMPKGGQLLLQTRNVYLSEEYTRDHPYTRPGHYVVFAVSDTGHGMTPEVKAHIFEPFFTTKGPGVGTGLGLATVYGIVKQSGGSIEVISGPGAGTTFEIYLPRVERAMRTSKSQAGTKRPAPLGSETVLLVEDEDAVRTLSKLILRQSGYTILEASNAEEALAVARRHTQAIHLVVTDVVMPEVGGRELTERLLDIHPEMRVLFVSGYTDDAVFRHGVSEAEVNFLQKPFTPLALASKVREVLDLSSLN
jgi:two-component system cell cycle sensor histidine kinase/response regulator CckA